MDETSKADVELAIGGDRSALERLLIAEMPALRGYLRLRMGQRLRSKESCSDLAQSVCREALGELSEFDFRGGVAFRHWLFKRALRKVMRRVAYYQAGKRDAGLEVDPINANGQDGDHDELLDAYATLCTPSRVVAGHEEVQRIEAAVDELPEAQREAILMHRIVGMSYGDIAEATDRSEGAVRTNVYRGLAELGIRLAQAKREQGDSSPE